MNRQQIDGSGELSVPKQRRSRNGCNECRRLHRRCDEGKPNCLNCLNARKTCSYNRTLSWGGRPFDKSPFRSALQAGVGTIPSSAASSGDAPKSFVYGQIASARSSPPPTESTAASLKRTRSVSRPHGTSRTYWEEDKLDLSNAIGTTANQISWLSDHHRTLFDHFANETIVMFHDSQTIQKEIKNTLLPLAINTNHGFSLLAAIISLAATHQTNVGRSVDEAEIEYWRDMSIGHLRRPGVHEDESTENCFAATALVLCIRDAISQEHRQSSWRLHLQGASTILRKDEQNLTPAGKEIRLVLTQVAKGLQLRSLLPTSATAGLDKMKGGSLSNARGIQPQVVALLKEIRKLRLERIALKAIEAHSDSSNMGRLWASLRSRGLEVILSLRALSQQDLSADDFQPTTMQLYIHAAVVQVYAGVLESNRDDRSMREAVDEGMKIMHHIMPDANAGMCVMLIFPCFTLGCVLEKRRDRSLVSMLLAGVAREFGKANGLLAAAILRELWFRLDLTPNAIPQVELDALIVERGWDLSLW